MSDWILAVLGLVALFAVVYLWTSRPKPRAKGGRSSHVQKAKSATSGERSAPTSTNAPTSTPAADLPKFVFEDDDDVDPTLVGQRAQPRAILSPPTQRIVYDEDAASEEPTQAQALIILSAKAQTDRGLRRKRNEDSVLALEDHGLFVVADGMGGYRGGEIASTIAVSTIERAFLTQQFPGPLHEAIPKRASELARAIQAANHAILDRAEQERELEGMGTTICAARFSANKQRLYIAHVGDSRIYRLRGGTLRQMTSDHTMRDLGVTGEGSNHLSRAVGVWPTVPIDIVLGKPKPGDVYLLCSDGLTKMVPDENISSILVEKTTPIDAVDELIRAANQNGGKDNVTVVVVHVEDALRPRVQAPQA